MPDFDGDVRNNHVNVWQSGSMTHILVRRVNCQLNCSHLNVMEL